MKEECSYDTLMTNYDQTRSLTISDLGLVYQFCLASEVNSCEEEVLSHFA